MSLSSALDAAKSSIAATATQTSLVSRNIANANDPTATRKYANLATGGRGVEVVSVARSANEGLFRNMVDANASLAGFQALAEGLERIDETIGAPAEGRSPAALIGELESALNDFAVSPGSFEFARAAVNAARDVANALNQASDTVQAVRQDADAALAAAAEEMNRLLAELEVVNAKVVKGTQIGSDVTDLKDRRDRIVVALSDYVGVNASTRGHDDLVLYTDSGVTLFETTARKVEFAPTSPLVPGGTGNVLRIDGVDVTGESAAMAVTSGKIHGLVTLRDEVTVAYQGQLDEIARGLVAAFSETDAAGATVQGLFTASDTPLSGPAANIAVAEAAIDEPLRLRDGAVGDPAWTPGPAGQTEYLNGYVAALNGEASGRVKETAAASLGWLAEARSDAIADVESKQTLLTRTRETLSDKTGINIDEEMTLLLSLERSYQASAKIIATVDEMFATLLASVR